MDKKETIWTFNFVALFIINGVMFFGQFMMGALLPKYLSGLGFASSVIGIIMGMFSVTALGTRPITGPLIDGMNRKTLYMIMLGLLTIASFGYAIADNIPLLVIFRLLHGVSMGCSSALALTLVAEVLPKSRLASGVSIYGMSSILSTAFGPGVGLEIMNRFGYPAAFSCAAVLTLMAFIVSSRLRLDPRPGHKIVVKLSRLLAQEALIPAFFIFLISLTRAGINTFFVIYITEDRNIPGIAVYYLINAGVLLISRPLFGRMADKHGIHRSLIPSFIFFAANLGLLAYCTQTWQLWIIGALSALGLGTAFSSLQALCMKVVPDNRRGAGSTTVFAGIDIGDLIGPVIAGVIVQFFGYREMFLASLLPLILCAYLLWLWVRKHHGIPDPPVESAG